ncbi:hypothetical protein F3Y22_tig00110683pilonHSYRG00166 [Hibiscus syriacus]|uniref:DNA (Cytosine-5)-methyltransferase DRM1/2 n=1 Tax=Hibiscus syriacus TaxID=106335 RepID=A0A6A2ZV21_HIBSY|nr:hypothetical protein F3Y22_tig00110683pilonHSYRG00166 [Hibiscus syriacus]
MPHMDLSEVTFKVPQHLLIQMLKVCSTLLLAEMSLQECPNIHITMSLQNTSPFYFWLKCAFKMFHMDLSELGLQNAPNLLNLKALEMSTPMQHVDSDNYSYDYKVIFQDNFTDIDSSSDTEEILKSDSDEESKLLYLTKMGCSEAEALIIMERCGLDSSIVELTNFICAAQMAKDADTILLITQRTLPEDAIGPPYFYYENVVLALVGSAKLTEKIHKALEAYDDEPPFSVQKYVLNEC